MFQVEWLQSALDELARISIALDSSGRRAMTNAVSQIDHELSDAPNSVGECRSGSLRIHFVPPLGLTFDVDVDDYRVTVVNIWFVK